MNLKVLVCVKQTFDTEAKIELKDGKISDAGINLIINPYDEVAVEGAIQLKEKNILLIDQFKVFGVPETYGRDSNEILELAYEVPESPFKGEIAEIYKLLSFKRMDEAKSKRDALVIKIGPEYNEVKRIDQFLEKVK